VYLVKTRLEKQLLDATTNPERLQVCTLKRCQSHLRKGNVAPAVEGSSGWNSDFAGVDCSFMGSPGNAGYVVVEGVLAGTAKGHSVRR
jgi:hypothetical protein